MDETLVNKKSKKNNKSDKKKFMSDINIDNRILIIGIILSICIGLYAIYLIFKPRPKPEDPFLLKLIYFVFPFLRGINF